MKKLLLATLLGAACVHASATVLKFDDVSANTTLASYGGLNWGSNWYVSGSYGAVSGANTAFNGFGVTQVQLGSGADFNFNGAYFTGWGSGGSAAGYTATSLTIAGYNNGNLVGQVTTALSPSQFNYVAANLGGIDELRFTQGNGSGHWWLMDNFTFNEALPASSQVPEPASLGLFGIALAGLALARRRKQG
jgi:hypothetical protein